MNAKLKDIFSLELSEKLSDFWPDDVSNFAISLRLMIGPEYEDASESFDLFVCTPEWIKENCIEHRYFWGIRTLIVLEYDLDCIKQQIKAYIASCSGKDWIEIACKINVMASWEFDNYLS